MFTHRFSTLTAALAATGVLMTGGVAVAKSNLNVPVATTAECSQVCSVNVKVTAHTQRNYKVSPGRYGVQGTLAVSVNGHRVHARRDGTTFRYGKVFVRSISKQRTNVSVINCNDRPVHVRVLWRTK